MGWPYSGTSGTHFLLASSPNVSTLAPRDVMGPAKEGWEQLRFKQRFSRAQRWDASTALPWDEIRSGYLARWNLSRPLLLENSPPEILHAQELHDTFAPHGKARTAAPAATLTS